MATPAQNGAERRDDRNSDARRIATAFGCEFNSTSVRPGSPFYAYKQTYYPVSDKTRRPIPRHVSISSSEVKFQNLEFTNKKVEENTKMQKTNRFQINKMHAKSGFCNCIRFSDQ